MFRGIKSTEKPIKYDTPQGSALGPLLFILFITNLHKALVFSSTHQFTGDTKYTPHWKVTQKD